MKDSMIVAPFTRVRFTAMGPIKPIQDGMGNEYICSSRRMNCEAAY